MMLLINIDVLFYFIYNTIHQFTLQEVIMKIHMEEGGGGGEE